MRADALINMTATGDYWDYSTVTDPDTAETTLTYHFVKTLPLVVLDTNTSSPVVFSRERLRFNGLLKNLSDASGVLVHSMNDVNQDVYLGTGMPVFDVFGSVMGYRHIITRKYNG